MPRSSDRLADHNYMTEELMKTTLRPNKQIVDLCKCNKVPTCILLAASCILLECFILFYLAHCQKKGSEKLNTNSYSVIPL